MSGVETHLQHATNATAADKPQTYQFSNEEIRVLKDCNRDSFFQRCLPIGSFLGVATYYGVQTGYFKAHPRWGATPKVLAASVIGYFIGKISYQTKCAERLMQLPDSKLGAMLRQKKRGSTLQESLEPGMSLNLFPNINPSDAYSDVDSFNNGDIDTNRPDQPELDDYQRPSLDSNPVFEEDTMPVPQNKTTTYEELRKQNRESYDKNRPTTYRGHPIPSEGPVVRRPPEQDTLQKSPPKRTNIYGDVME